jgi:hypothetical protein
MTHERIVSFAAPLLFDARFPSLRTAPGPMRRWAAIRRACTLPPRRWPDRNVASLEAMPEKIVMRYQFLYSSQTP